MSSEEKDSYAAQQFLSRKAYLVFRLSAMLFYIGYVTLRVIATGVLYLAFLTYWSWTLDTIYFILGFILLLHDNSVLHKIHTALFAIVQPLALMVTIGFWALLTGVTVGNEQYDPFDKLQFIMGHTLNMFFPIGDLIFTNTTVTYQSLIYPLIFGLFYITLLVTGRTVGRYEQWPYPFLDGLIAEKGGYQIYWGTLILVAFAGVFALCSLCLLIKGLCHLRDRAFVRRREITTSKSLMDSQYAMLEESSSKEAAKKLKNKI